MRRPCALTTIALMVLVQRARAEDRAWTDGLRARLSVDGVHSVDYGAAEVSFVRAHGLVSLEGPLSDDWVGAASWSLEYEGPRYEDEGAFLPGGAAPRDLVESTFRIGARRRVTDHWWLGAQPYLSAKLEVGADLEDGLKGGSVFVVGYTHSDDLEILAGIKLGTKLDRSGAFVWPYLRVRWQIRDDLQLRLDSATLRLAYELSDDLDLIAFAGGRTDRYRLDASDGPAVGPAPATFSLTEISAGAGARVQLSPRVRLAANAGLSFWQRIRIADRDADRLASRSTHDPAPFLTLQLESRF
ncbi:MAG: hypothetical protein FJ091_02580 [Deltaproteobacteria bacterium]|nr:hypothetical protein [Deltaproteobacteria bacterium]